MGDEMVYELYRLSEEEIKIVEGNKWNAISPNMINGNNYQFDIWLALLICSPPWHLFEQIDQAVCNQQQKNGLSLYVMQLKSYADE